MSRYTTRPRGRGYVEDHLYESDHPLIPGCDVAEHKPKFTGLLDARGEEIWREPRPIGFGRDGEWA